MPLLAGLVDAGLEASVAGSFTRIGYDVRSHPEDWQPAGRPRREWDERC